MDLISGSYRDKVHVQQIIAVTPKAYINVTLNFSDNTGTHTLKVKPRYAPVPTGTNNWTKWITSAIWVAQ
jgi:hypothetical protein